MMTPEVTRRSQPGGGSPRWRARRSARSQRLRHTVLRLEVFRLSGSDLHRGIEFVALGSIRRISRIGLASKRSEPQRRHTVKNPSRERRSSGDRGLLEVKPVATECRFDFGPTVARFRQYLRVRPNLAPSENCWPVLAPHLRGFWAEVRPGAA